MRSQKFLSNPKETLILVTNTFVMSLEFLSYITETHWYDFTSASANFDKAKASETSSMSHIAVINSNDNSLWYLQVQATGQLTVVRKISNYYKNNV